MREPLGTRASETSTAELSRPPGFPRRSRIRPVRSPSLWRLTSALRSSPAASFAKDCSLTYPMPLLRSRMEAAGTSWRLMYRLISLKRSRPSWPSRETASSTEVPGEPRSISVTTSVLIPLTSTASTCSIKSPGLTPTSYEYPSNADTTTSRVGSRMSGASPRPTPPYLPIVFMFISRAWMLFSNWVYGSKDPSMARMPVSNSFSSSMGST
mmetsp:Transcript_11865/g.36181  ORF Transcript_11865/g.36181 Transcript_11865/m.36181 type:complete len:211 (-) Transcript_11865:578-1210(-)